MSINQSALSALQQSVTASNAEAGAKSALATWKGMCVSWEQETADAVGKASANYAIKWNNAVMPEIEAKIQKFQAEYDEKRYIVRTFFMYSCCDFIVFYRIIWILEVVWMKYKILVVDDDKELVKMLCSYFNMKQYETITATDGMEALNKIKMKPDIILLDINMPRMDGIEVCRLIRSKVLCPILFLTARVDEDDKINGLLSGGDDYITKPFSLRELEARIVTNIKREERHQQKTEYRFMDEMLIDYSEKIVAIAGHRMEFTKIEYQIIEFLSMHPGQVFDKERIYAQVCGYDAEGDSRTITELVRRIRKKIADYSEKEYIETVWGIGYRWKK